LAEEGEFGMGIFSKISASLGLSREMSLDEFMTAGDA